MSLTDTQRETLKNMGALGYPVENCISVLQPEDPAAFRSDFEDPASEVARIYKHGGDEGQYILDKKLYDLAAEGNLAAMKELDIRKKKMLNASRKNA